MLENKFFKMNSLEIESLLKLNRWNRFKFLGCFASDDLPIVNNDIPCCFIANVDQSSEKGSHWVSFVIPKVGYLEYFCPLGISFYHWPLFVNYIRNIMCFDTILMNKRRIQSSGSNLCGIFCIEYLIKRDKGNSFALIINSYSISNYLCNDLQALNFINDFKRKHKKDKI